MFEFVEGSFQGPGELQSSQGKSARNELDQLDFELEFFNRILEESPEYLDVLRVHANNLSTKGLYVQGLAADRRIVQLRPKDPLAHYNLACSYSLLHMSAEALESLQSSLKLGYSDFEHILDDPDLEHLRRDSRFVRLLGRFLQKALEPRKPRRKK